MIDHISRDRRDCRFVNLRAATYRLNNINRQLKSDLPAGVRKTQSGKYEAAMGNKESYRYLGLFKTAEEASAAYQAVATEVILEEQLKAEKEWLYE